VEWTRIEAVYVSKAYYQAECSGKKKCVRVLIIGFDTYEYHTEIWPGEI